MADRDDYWFFQSQTAPTPLAGPVGEAWWLLWGNVKDGWREGTREATKASLPSLAAPDALAAYAAERNTEQYPSESEADYRTRLAETFDRYAFLGTPTGVTAAVEAASGITSVLYREAWQWDLGSPLWARFWLVCGTTYDPPRAWGDGWAWGDGTLWGITAPRESIDFLRRQIRRWKAGHAKLAGCALLFDGRAWGDGWTWGDGTLWSGDAAVLCS